ncbi:MAG: NAD(P)-dependent oxidoreductase [Candidatus Eutrophobiaceae bacterium]
MKIGIIGLGSMGRHMALNLQKAGVLHRAWNRSSRDFGTLQPLLAASIAELAAECELIISCVSQDADVLDVVAQIAQTTVEGAIVVDTSTVGAATAQRAAALLGKRGAQFLDAPVSGGVEGAQKGALSMMVGGDAEALERCRPILGHIASRIVHIGPSGSGQACKAVNQIMAAGINQAVTEALAFGAAQGLDMDKVLEAVRSGAAGNWFLDHRGESMLRENFKPGFKLALHHKDLLICREMNRKISDNDLPVVEMTLLHYQRLMEAGHGEKDISTLFLLKKQWITNS